MARCSARRLTLTALDKQRPEFKVLQGQCTFDWEGDEIDSGDPAPATPNSRLPNVPSEDSGLTVGRGYDLLKREKATVKAIFKKIGVDEATAEAYAGGVGKKGITDEDSACVYIDRNYTQLKPLQPEQQKKLFQITYLEKAADVVRICYKPDTLKAYGVVNWSRLHPKVKDILVDVCYLGAYSTQHRKFLQTKITNLGQNPSQELADFKDLFANPEKPEHKWSKSVDRNRLKHISTYADPIDNLLVPDPTIGGKTFEWESSNFTPTLYKDLAYGVVIGRGYVLGKRKCFKGLKEYKIKVQSGEIIQQLRYAGVEDNQLQLYADAAGLLDNEADKYLKKNEAKFIPIKAEIEKRLFNLIYPAYEADVMRICSSTTTIDKYGFFDWFGLDEKIKTVLVDLAFTDHYDFPDVIAKLQGAVARNDRTAFANALKGWKDWKIMKNKQSLWETRFQQRLNYLSSNDTLPCWDWIGLIFPSMKPQNMHLLDESATLPVALPILEPGSPASAVIASGITSELKKLSNIVPQMIQITREVVATGQQPKITDICFPILDMSMLIKDAGLDISTDIVEIAFPTEEFANIQKGMRLRYQKIKDIADGTSSFRYAYITDVLEGNKLSLSEKINLKDLATGYFQVDSAFFLPLNKFNLSSLLGDALPSIDIMISSRIGKVATLVMDEPSDGKYKLPILLDMFIPKLKEGKAEYQHFEFLLDLGVQRKGFSWRLVDTTLSLSLPPSDEEQIFEFEVFSLVFPKKTGQNPDIRFDLEKRDFFFLDNGAGSPKLYFPGGLKDEVKGKSPEVIKAAKNKRFVFDFLPKEIDPNNPSSFKYLFRINNQGVSFKAKLTKEKVELFQTQERLIVMEPSDKVEGTLEITNNRIVAASISAGINLPGFKSLRADVDVSLRKEQPDAPPVVIAGIALKNVDDKPLAEMDFAMLQMQLTRVALKLTWQGNKWDLRALVDGSISFTSAAEIMKDLEALKCLSAITVENLDLVRVSLKDAHVNFQLKKDVEFSILDNLFAFSLADLRFGFDEQNVYLYSKYASVQFGQPGTLEITIDTGSRNNKDDALRIGVKKAHADLEILKPLGITVKLGPNITFRGECGWVRTDDERYFYASGYAEMEGFPRFDGLLKIGAIIKENGQSAPNIVVYGAVDLDIELYPGVVVKNLGCGMGVNNRLTGIGANPNETQILENLDKIVPSQISGWSGVHEDGFYLSIVGSAILASNPGSNNVINAYVVELILSLDTELNAVAAGRLWFASSVDFARRYRSNPALVGALALSPRQRRLGARLETRPNPKVEANDWLKTILNMATVRVSFQLSPQVVDYYLEEVRFQAEFWGIQMKYICSFRFAIFRYAVLLKSMQLVSGSYRNSLRAGPGGIDFRGEVNMSLAYAGLISSNGIVVYGRIDTRVAFEIVAFIEIGFEITIRFFGWKKTISWHVRFEISLKADIRFSGAAALIESGRVGFDGVAQISLSICGFGLSIRVAFSFNPEVVHQAIQKVAAFERLLDTFENRKPAAMLLALEAVPLLRFTSIEPVATEKWYHYYNAKTNYHLLIPAENSPWYVPCYSKEEKKLIGEVTSITIGGNVKTIHPFWTKLVNGEAPDQYKNAIGCFLETASEQNYREIDHHAPKVLLDPRVNTDARDYLSYKDQILPSYVLSYEFRDLSELVNDETSTVSQKELQEIIDYETAKNRYAAFSRHSLDNEDAYERMKQTRARVVKALMDDLNDPESPKLFGEDVDPNTKQVTGLIFSGSKDLLKAKVSIYRNGNPAEIMIERVAIGEQNAAEDYRPSIQALPIRQKYIEPETAQAGSAYAKIIVKLPVRMEEKFIQEGKLSQLSHFQVYRQLPNQERPECIADFCHLDVSMFNYPELQMKAEKIVEINQQQSYVKLKVAEPDHEALKAKVGRQRSGEKSVLLVEGHFISVDKIDVGDVITVITKADLSSVKLESNCTLFVNYAKTVLIDPYIFTDTYYVKNSQVYVKREGNQWYDDTGIILGQSEVSYFLKVVPFDTEEENDNIKRQISFKTPLKLYVPKEADFPKSLAIVFSVDSLCSQARSFQFIDLETKQVKLIERESFELWAKQIPLRRTGFYGGEEEVYFSRSGNKPSLDKVNLDPPRESTVGKIKVELVNGKYQLETALDSNYGYKFFARPKPAFAQQLLNPLQHVLVKKFPSNWHKDMKVKLVEQIEWYDDTAVSAVQKLDYPEFYINEVFDPKEDYNYIDINFVTAGVNTGGVEIFINDQDESNVCARQTCELMEEDIYVQDQKSLSQPSYWDVSPAQHSVSIPYSQTAAAADVSNIFYFDFDASKGKSVVIKAMNEATEALALILKQDSYDWRSELYTPLLNYFSALNTFENSPLNINNRDVVNAINDARWYGLNLLIGSKGLNSLSEAQQKIEKFDADIASAVASEPNMSEDRYTDVCMARKLIGILRRRTACAAALASLIDVKYLPVASGFSHLQIEQLASQTLWDEINLFVRGQALTKTQAILEAFGLPKRDAKALENVIEAIRKQSESLAKVVPQAKALAEFLDSLEESGRKSFYVEKKPHHTVNSAIDQEKGKVPKAIKGLTTFFPGGERLRTKENTDVLSVELSKQIACFFNLMEYLGFSIDLSLVGVNSVRFSQEEILSKIKAVSFPADYVTFLVKPRSPTISKTSDESIGFSFVQLCMIPKEFYQAMVAGNQTLVANWLRFRGVEMATEEATSLFNVVKFINQYVEDQTNPVTELCLQPWDRRWLTLPSIGNRTETSYRVPDRYGHRYGVAIRKISRYEPLVHWRDGVRSVVSFKVDQFNPADWKQINVNPVYPAGKEEINNMLQVYNLPDPQIVHFIYQLPQHAARSMKNQVAAIRTGYKGTDLVFRHELIDQLGPKSWKQVINNLKFENSVSLTPKFTAESIDYKESQRGPLFDQERLLQIPDLPYYYRYFLTSRVIYQSKKETSEAFYQETVQIPKNDKVKELTIRNPYSIQGLYVPSRPWLVQIDAQTSAKVVDVDNPENPKLKVTLERAVSLDGGSYDLRFYQEATSATAEPKYKGIFEPKITKVENPEENMRDYMDLDMEIYLSRHIDYYQGEQSALPKGSEQLHQLEVSNFLIHELPDLCTDYFLFWRVEEPAGEYYMPVLSIRMPWSEEGGTGSKPVIKNISPFLSVVGLDPKVPEVDIHCTAVPSSAVGFPYTPRYVYTIKFTLRVLPENIAFNLFNHPGKYVLQGARKNSKTHPVKVGV